MTDNSEQTLTLSVEEAARLLGISPGLAYDLRSVSSCARRQLRDPPTVRAKFGERFSVTAITGIGRSSGGSDSLGRPHRWSTGYGGRHGCRSVRRRQR